LHDTIIAVFRKSTEASIIHKHNNSKKGNGREPTGLEEERERERERGRERGIAVNNPRVVIIRERARIKCM